jgi:hypothetical protein
MVKNHNIVHGTILLPPIELGPMGLGVLGISNFDQGAINEFNALGTLKSI